MERIIILGLLLALPAQDAGKAQDPPKLGLSSQEIATAKDLVKRIFEAKSFADQQALLKELDPLDHPSKSDMALFQRECFRHVYAGPRQDGGKSPTQCTNPAYPGKYILHVPAAAKKGAKTGLFIGLHGGGPGVGDGAQIEGLFGAPSGTMILVYPTVIQKDAVAWNTEREEQYVLAILAELRRSFSIDTNHVYIAGHSMGGWGTWSIAGRHADLFAGASAMAGGTVGPGTVANLKNLPFWFYHSTDDPQVNFQPDHKAAELLESLKKEYGPYDFVYKEYNDIGHGLPKEGLKPIWDWLFAKKREPFPRHVIWEPSRSYKQHFYWLKSEGSGRIEAKLENQKITLKGSVNTVFLNEKMLKYAEEVVVADAGGSVLWKGKPALSLAALVESIAVRQDPEMIFTAQVRLRGP
jgi:pimeloyl-ACP methyl ester carboxylesterase